MKKILVFSGSNSSTSINQALCRFAATLISAHETKVIELRDYQSPLYNADIEKNEGIPEETHHLLELFHQHDAFMISLPEYNGSLTPLFKNTIDWISRVERPIFQEKPVLLLGASPGKRGTKSNQEYVARMMPHWGASTVLIFRLPNFHDNFDKAKMELTDSGKRDELKSVIGEFESILSGKPEN
jgi:NAD(P)H-dependent FMN reductase